jgi:hypothetical protein
MLLQNQTTLCPNCNNRLCFESNTTSCIACSKCSSLIKRNESGLEVKFKVKLVPEDMTVFRIGTSGNYRGNKFILTGRIRSHTGGKYFNLWAALMDDKTFQWLSEGYGFYSIFKRDPAFPQILSSSLSPGKSIKYIGGKTLYVDCINKANSFSCEGEIPEEIISPAPCISIDFSNNKLDLVMIHALSKDNIFGYSGHRSSFGELNLKDTRDINDWI